MAFMKDANGKEHEMESDTGQFTNRPFIQKKKKPLHALGPSQKNVPKNNVSAEMEMADESPNLSRNDH